MIGVNLLPISCLRSYRGAIWQFEFMSNGRVKHTYNRNRSDNCSTDRSRRPPDDETVARPTVRQLSDQEVAMRRVVTAALVLTMLSVLAACANKFNSNTTFPLPPLSDVDSLTVLMHFERSGVPISQTGLENNVLEALEQMGVGVSRDAPPYLHVRVYCRCGEPTMSDQDTTRGDSTSWHFGMWVNQSAEYSRVWGPLQDICPSGPIMWSTGGSGAVADGELSDFIQTSLSEFAEDYRTANPNR